MANIYVIGAGAIGSRHLQALRRVSVPLHITVVDPSLDALKIAKARFEEIPAGTNHMAEFVTTIPDTANPVAIAIIATNSRTRKTALDTLLKLHPVRFLILEKILFDRAEDYDAAAQLISASGAIAWVNCPMRMMSPYRDLRASCAGKPIIYRVSGNFGLMTTAIHYLDHVAYLTGTNDFDVDISGLDPTVIPAKRAGFEERTGTLRAKGTNGSIIEITSRPGTGSPVIEISCEDFHTTLHEDQLDLPLQSTMTIEVIKELLEHGTCPLTPLEDSIKLHRAYLSHFQSPYPFT